MRKWLTPSVVADALFVSIVAGEQLCREHPELERDDPAANSLRLGFGEVGDPSRILHDVTLYLGLSPVYGWSGDELQLLASLAGP